MKNFVLAAMVISLCSCASTDVKDRVAREMTDTKIVIEKAKATLTSRPIMLPVLAFPYFGNKSVAEAQFLEELPRVLRSEQKAHFSSKGVTAEEFARLITEETGIPTKIFADSSTNQLITNGGKQTVKTVDISALPAMNFKQLMDTAIPQFGLDWDFYDGSIHIETTFRKTYQVNVTPNTTKSSLKIGKNSAAGQGAGVGNTSITGNFSSTLESTFDGEIDPVKDIELTLVQMVGDNKKVFLNKSIGIATINCSKDCHRQVKSFLDSANYLLTQQVFFHVDEITVSSTTVGQSGIDWNLVYQKAANNGKGMLFSLGTPANLVQTIGGAITSNIFSPVNNSVDHFESSKMLIKALSQVSNVVDKKPYSVIAMNNEPATLTSVDQQSYTAASTVVPTGTLGTPVFSQTAGYATYGQLIQITPTILPGGRIIVRFGLDDTKLKNITPGQNQGDVDKLLLGSDKLQTKAVLRVGSTLVLSGFKRMSSTTDARGLFKNQTLGSEAANTDTTETVILITPYISGV